VPAAADARTARAKQNGLSSSRAVGVHPARLHPRAAAEYDVRYWLNDLASLIFFLKAIPLPERFDPDAHWRAVSHLISDCGSPRGVQTNEHRYLLITEKSAA